MTELVGRFDLVSGRTDFYVEAVDDNDDITV
jgi:hypothetical protein